MPVEGTPLVIPTSHNLLSAPGVTSRAPEYFTDPLYWNPHRWGNGESATIDEQKEEKTDYGYGLISKGANSPYLPFGSGRHRCIGEQFAYVQLGAITVALVRTLKLKMPEGVEGVPDTDYSVSINQGVTASPHHLRRILFMANPIAVPFFKASRKADGSMGKTKESFTVMILCSHFLIAMGHLHLAH